MKFAKKAFAAALAAVLTAGMTVTAFAEAAPHLLFATERTYGEDKTQYGSLYRGTETDYYLDLGNRYAIVPKTDTFIFEKNSSRAASSHNMVMRWWCPNPTRLEDGAVAFSWEDSPIREEKFEYGREYAVYTPEMQEKVAELSASGYYQTTSADEPFFILDVTDYDLSTQWLYIYQVSDNWKAPAADKGAWASNDKGWWIQFADGSYLKEAWYQSPESGLWYYMGADGYMLTDTETPDGYRVNADGAWVQ